VWLEIAGAFAIILAVMSWIQFAGPAILDNDGYYHIRWARNLAQAAPQLPEFDALPLTTLNAEDYADHHYLFHLVLIPFTVGDLRVGAKVAAAVLASVGIASVFALLAADGVRYRWLWLAPLVASSEPFLYRMAMTRAPSLSLACLGLGAYLILKRKLLALAILGFAFAWLYSLFPLLPAMAALGVVSRYLTERRLDFGPVAAAVAGVAAGLVINPYFPKNVALLGRHLLTKLAPTYPVDVGVEWYPYDTWVVLESSAVAFVIYFVALACFDFRGRAGEHRPLFFLLVSLLLLLMMFKSRRFVEYWPPFAVAFGAFVISPKVRGIRREYLARMRDRVIASMALAVLLVAGVVSMGAVLLRAHRDVKSELDPQAFEGAATWLAQNTPVGSLVFNTDWDDFPMLFYYNTSNAYVVGLDPTYLYDRDPELWKLYARITLGEEAVPAPLIRERFRAEYVVTDNVHTAFLNVAAAGSDFETVYRDRHATVLRIKGTE
jgi:hypothetical protein